MSLRVGLLGRLTVAVDGQPVAVVGPRRRVVLAALALSAGRPVSRELLAEHMWGTAVPDGARGRLHTTVTRLRQLLGPGLITGAQGAHTLEVGHEAVDALKFRQLAAAARAAEGDAALECLNAALSLWRGDVLEGIDSESLAVQHARPLTEEWHSAVVRRIDLLLARGEHVAVLSELWDLTSRHPLREPLWQRLMIALYRSGRQGDALSAYQAARASLSETLGLDPGAELQRLQVAVLRNDPGLAWTPPREELDTGSGTGGEAYAGAASLASQAEVVPRQLPSDIAGFVGRLEQLAALNGLLPSDSVERAPVVIATVGGSAGIGKTALAVHWAHRIADRFPDGQLYVNLRGYGRGEPMSPAAALEHFLRALGTPACCIPADVDARAALLRTTLADRRVLILLDNAVDADHVRPLLPGSDSLVIVTSRNPMRGLAVREGARRIILEELTPEESVALLERSVGRQRVADEHAAAAELVEFCDRLPLALAIAAERVASTSDMTLAALVQQLRDHRDRLDALRVGDDPTSELRPVFSWSYQTLDPEAARMFRLLALHPGNDISVHAAAALSGATVPRAGRLLECLADAFLVQRKRPGRYEQHDLTRAYAAELAGHHESRQQRARAIRGLLEWYVHTAENARPLLHPCESTVMPPEPEEPITPMVFGDDRGAFAWHEAELGNVRAAIRLAYENNFDQICWRLVFATWVAFFQRDAWEDLLDNTGFGLRAARRVGDVIGEAHMLTAKGTAHRGAGRGELAAEIHRAALDKFRGAGDRAGEATALNNLGAVCRDLERFDEALHWLEQCHAIDQERGEPGNLATSLLQLAKTLAAAGRHAEAMEFAVRAADQYAKLPHRRGESIALNVAALAQAGRGRHHKAIKLYRQSALISGDLGDVLARATSLAGLGRSQRQIGQATAALETLRLALAILEDLGAPAAADVRRELAYWPVAGVTAAVAPGRGDERSRIVSTRIDSERSAS